MSSDIIHFGRTQTSGQTPFDNSTNGFVSGDAQAAIEELKNSIIASASPGFTFGRSGTVTKGSFLLADTVPSNKTGRRVYIHNAKIKKIFVGGDPSNTYTMEVMHHSGGGTSLTSITTVTITAAFGGSFDVDIAVPHGVDLCMRVAPGSANSAKELVCGLSLSGTLLP
jgi:hypothetical protein